MKVTPQEKEIVQALRGHITHAKTCGAFNEEEQANEGLMMRSAIQRLAGQVRSNYPGSRSALRNYEHF